MTNSHWVGIDYGAKLAGTSVICRRTNTGFEFYCSEPKKDADQFIYQTVIELKPSQVFLDAPLGLPIRYQSKNKKESDSYFYRKCDEETGAMSPLFLGGLTARAIQLKDRFESQNIKVFETYPGNLWRQFNLNQLQYKKDLMHIEACYHAIDSKYPKPNLKQLRNWHMFDSWLAWLSGWRFENQSHISYGDASEGLILV